MSAQSESSQPAAEPQAVEPSHDVNTANTELSERVARLEAFAFGAGQHKELTVAQTAQRLGVHRRTVLRWVAAGEIPGARRSRGVYSIPRTWVADQLITRNPITKENEQ